VFDFRKTGRRDDLNLWCRHIGYSNTSVCY
jgi:hypothetical protein